MRLKVDIQPYDPWRILFFGTNGLSESSINAINKLAKKEGWNDVAFATMDDGRIGLVCKPATGAKIISWDAKNNKTKYPEDFEREFIRKANQALYSNDLKLYVEKLTKDEEDLKKFLHEEVIDIRDKGLDEGKGTWDEA